MKRLIAYLVVVGVVSAVPAVAATSKTETPTITLKAANRYGKKGVATIFAKPNRGTLGNGVVLEDVFKVKEVQPCKRAVLRHPHNPQLNKPYPGHFDGYAILEITKRQYSPSGELTAEETEPNHRTFFEVAVEKAHKGGMVSYQLRGRYRVYVNAL